MTLPSREETIDTMVRDFCAVGPRPKSEVRRRINELVDAALSQSAARIGKLEKEREYYDAEVLKLQEIITEEDTDREKAESEIQSLRDHLNAALAYLVSPQSFDADALRSNWAAALLSERTTK
jgi:Arc/MetJ family transcription regulator